MPIRLVAKTFTMTSADHPLTVKRLNARKFKTFVIKAQEFSKATGAELFDKLVELLSSVIVEFKEDYTDEDDIPLETVAAILWALEVNELNTMCQDIINAVKLGDTEVKNLNSSQAQHTAESVGNVETAVKTEKEPVSNTQEGTEQ